VNDPPVPVVSSPLHQQVFNTTTPIYFDAGNSTDDDLIHGDSLSYHWSSSVFGTLGNQEHFFITLTDTGWHNITLKVTDSEKSEVKTVVSVRVVTAAIVDNGNGGDPPDGPEPGGETPTDEESSSDYSWLVVLAILIIILVVVVMFMWQRNKATRELERELELEEQQAQQQQVIATLPVIQPPLPQQQMIMQRPQIPQPPPPLPPINPFRSGMPPPPVVIPKQAPVQPRIKQPPRQ
jgi:hypothetical protein